MFTGWMECQHAIKDIVVSKVRVSLALLSLSVRDWVLSLECSWSVSCIVNAKSFADNMRLTFKTNLTIVFQLST